MTATYPAFLNLAGRRCVVVGGGAVAERKIRGLVASEAAVVVVAPATTLGIDALERDGAVAVERRPYESGDLAGACIVVAATSSRRVTEAVVHDARMVGVLVNVVDDPAACDLIVPAVVRRGDVTLAVSTGGRSPGFARFLREELDAWLSEEQLDVLELVAEVRAELRAVGVSVSPEQWRQVLRADALAASRAGDRASARKVLRAALAPDLVCADPYAASRRTS